MNADNLSSEEIKHLKYVISGSEHGATENMRKDSVAKFQQSFGLTTEELSKALKRAKQISF